MRVSKVLIVTAGTAGIISGALWAWNLIYRTRPRPPNNRFNSNNKTGKSTIFPTPTKPTKTECRTKPNDHLHAENTRKNGVNEPRPKIRIRLP